MSLRFPIRIAVKSELRLVELKQSQELFALVEANRAQLGKYLPWVEPTRSAADVEKFLRGALKQHADNLGFHGCIWHEKRPVGMAGFHPIDWANRNVALGYWIAREAQGKGLVTAAVRALLRVSFRHYELHRVEIQCATGNRKSCAIARRLGFRREGVLRGVQKLGEDYNDTVVYSMLDSEWE